jgi:hypothetical protein
MRARISGTDVISLVDLELASPQGPLVRSRHHQARAAYAYYKLTNAISYATVVSERRIRKARRAMPRSQLPLFPFYRSLISGTPKEAAEQPNDPTVRKKAG